MFVLVTIVLVSLALLYPEFMDSSIKLFMRYEETSSQSAEYARYGSLLYRVIGVVIAVLISFIITKGLRFVIDKLGGALGGVFYIRRESDDNVEEDYNAYFAKIPDKIKEWSAAVQSWIVNHVKR